MEPAESLQLLLLACELAVRVDSRPERRDGSDAAVYASSGRTLARRLQTAGTFTATLQDRARAEDPAPFCWEVSLQAGAARRTNYTVWLNESLEQLQDLLRAREQARALRESLPHDQRKKKPWGPL
jgi:hypothetical protein